MSMPSERSEFRSWSGARDLNPGPHGPELCDLPSRDSETDRFQFDSAATETRAVQICGVLWPDYYMKYYIRASRAGNRLGSPDEGVGDDLRQRLDESRTRVERSRAPEDDSVLARKRLRLDVKVVQDLEVIRDEANRAHKHIACTGLLDGL